VNKTSIRDSTKGLRNAIHNDQFITNLETPPQIRNTLIQPRCENRIDVAEDTLMILERQLLAQKTHHSLEALPAADFEARLS